VLLLDPLPVLLGQVGQGDVIAFQKRVAQVVILQIEALAKARRRRPRCVARDHLADKTKDALIVAAPDVGVKGGMLEREAQRPPRFPLDLV
jgi:hypothetical protein